MAEIVKMSNDSQRVTLLQRVVAAAAEETGPARLQGETVAQAQSQAVAFAAALDAMAAHTAQGRALSGQLREGIARLKASLRRVWREVQEQVRSDGVDPAVRALYHLPSQGARKDPTNRADWLYLTQRVLQGDAQARDDGYPGAASTPDLQGVYDTVQGLYSQHLSLKQEAQAGVRAVQQQRAGATQLIRRIVKELRLSLLEDEETERDVLVRYGFRLKGKEAGPVAGSPRSLESAPLAREIGPEQTTPDMQEKTQLDGEMAVTAPLEPAVSRWQVASGG